MKELYTASTSPSPMIHAASCSLIALVAGVLSNVISLLSVSASIMAGMYCDATNGAYVVATRYLRLLVLSVMFPSASRLFRRSAMSLDTYPGGARVADLYTGFACVKMVLHSSKLRAGISSWARVANSI